MVVIVGASIVPINRYYESSAEDLAFEAYKGLTGELKDRPKADVVVISSTYAELSTNSVNLANKIASYLGHQGSAVMRVEAGESGGPAVYTAFSLIKSGIADSVLLIGVEKMADQHGKTIQEYMARGLNYKDYLAGIMPVHYAALMMKKYMEVYKVDYDYFVNWPVKMHSYAVENPMAMLKFKVTPQQVKDSSVISEPIRLYDTGARGDGAAVVLLTSEEVARKYSDDLAKLQSVKGSSGDLEVSTSAMAVRDLALKLGDSVRDYYVQVHDSYSVAAAIQLEDLGLLPRGRSLTELDSVEVNFEGGLKARGYPGGATAVYQLAEIYLQLTQKFKGRTTSKEKALVISTDDLMTVAYGAKVIRE